MSRLTDLIRQVKQKDPQLGADLEAEVKVLSGRRAFGLNFERHRPEAVELPQRPVQRGDKVRILPPRGSSGRGDTRLWRAEAIVGTNARRMARLSLLESSAPEQKEIPVGDLVVVAEFRDPIHPGLVSTGKVERGGEKPFHTVVNGENFHVLEALTYTHRGKIDAIYIDPPYNTGAKDWKYNNDYVDGEDAYRHSKWLAFMERRLAIANELLNPRESVLVVTIDEKEYLRLGLLLGQIFADATIQMVTIVTNPNGVARGAELARVEEYAYFCFIGRAKPERLDDTFLGERVDRDSGGKVRWEWLMRGGSNSRRSDRPNLFYPIFIDPETRTISAIGEALATDLPISTVPDRAGLTTVWPIRANGQEATWRTSNVYLSDLVARGMARVGAYNGKSDRWSILYLGKAQIRRIEEGEIESLGHSEAGSLLLRQAGTTSRMVPKTVWSRQRHTAGEYGSRLLRALIPGRSFPFPKSLYATEDALRIVIAGKPDAIVVDFFAGSGTTAHAVMRLNRQDGGRRQCISVTNNEVSADEQGALRRHGLRPGDPKWEALGICDYITKPRIQAAITGRTPDGETIKGDYKFIDEFPMAEGLEENAEFFTLTYEAPVAVSHNLAFERIAPLLWLRAGSQGRRIETISDVGWDVADVYGILFELDRAAEFVVAVAEANGVVLVRSHRRRPTFPECCAQPAVAGRDCAPLRIVPL